MRLSRPRVLQVITHLALGGAERVAFNLLHGLKDRYDFAVYAANGVDPGPVGQSMKAELEQLGVPLFVGTSVPIKRGGMLLAGHWFAKAIKQFKPDLIHLHTEIPESSYAAMVLTRPGLKKIPLVRTIHNTIYWNPWRPLGRWADAKMPRSYVACVSQGAVDAFNEVRRESKAGPLPKPPRVIYNGVLVPTVNRPLRDATKIKLLFAGRFENQKGADLLPGILQKIRLPLPAELSIFGSGTHEPALKALAAAPPPGWTITLSGPTPNLSQRMPQFDLMLMPSRYEGLALLAIEAALVGLPTIATDGPGVREGFPSDYEYLAAAGDADSFAAKLQHAIDHPESWSPAVEKAAAFARQHFDLKAMCDAYNELYRQAGIKTQDAD